jgi:uncharacterized membrane-anchored protein YjiN (DUF445 family)
MIQGNLGSRTERTEAEEPAERLSRDQRQERGVSGALPHGAEGEGAFLAGQQRGLRRMKLFATGLLVLMAFVYGISRFFQGKYPFLGAVSAFAEAATVGALADWFAVVALFRHPLHLPIPKTAVIPRNRDRIGEALARFMREHFLSKDVLEGKMASVDLAGVAGNWMSGEKNASQMAQRLTEYLPHLVDQFAERTEGKKGQENQDGQSARGRTGVSALVRTVSEPIRRSALFRRLTIDILSSLETILTEKVEQSAAGMGKEQPSPASDYHETQRSGRYRGMVHAGLRRVRRGIGNSFYNKISDTAARVLGRDDMETEQGREAGGSGERLPFRPTLRHYLPGAWRNLKNLLIRELADPGPDFTGQVATAIQRLGTALATDERLKRKVNEWLRTWVTEAAVSNRQLLVEYISETVKAWDPEATSRRIELHVGRDLQWIRINGTIVGGLAGLLIYALSCIVRSLH